MHGWTTASNFQSHSRRETNNPWWTLSMNNLLYGLQPRNGQRAISFHFHRRKDMTVPLGGFFTADNRTLDIKSENLQVLRNPINPTWEATTKLHEKRAWSRNDPDGQLQGMGLPGIPVVVYCWPHPSTPAAVTGFWGPLRSMAKDERAQWHLTSTWYHVTLGYPEVSGPSCHLHHSFNGLYICLRCMPYS